MKSLHEHNTKTRIQEAEDLQDYSRTLLSTVEVLQRQKFATTTIQNLTLDKLQTLCKKAISADPQTESGREVIEVIQAIQSQIGEPKNIVTMVNEDGKKNPDRIWDFDEFLSRTNDKFETPSQQVKRHQHEVEEHDAMRSSRIDSFFLKMRDRGQRK